VPKPYTNPKKRNRHETILKPMRNQTETAPKTMQRNRETIPYRGGEMVSPLHLLRLLARHHGTALPRSRTASLSPSAALRRRSQPHAPSLITQQLPGFHSHLKANKPTGKRTGQETWKTYLPRLPGRKVVRDGRGSCNHRRSK
jgi:hypothetical protein